MDSEERSKLSTLIVGAEFSSLSDASSHPCSVAGVVDATIVAVLHSQDSYKLFCFQVKRCAGRSALGLGFSLAHSPSGVAGCHICSFRFYLIALFLFLRSFGKIIRDFTEPWSW